MRRRAPRSGHLVSGRTALLIVIRVDLCRPVATSAEREQLSAESRSQRSFFQQPDDHHRDSYPEQEPDKSLGDLGLGAR